MSLLCLSQTRASATLLVLAGGNYEIGFEEENLVVLCIKIQIQIKYIKIFPGSSQRCVFVDFGIHRAMRMSRIILSVTCLSI